MLQYVLTALAGIALGIAAMRVWQMRETPDAAPGSGPAALADDAVPASETGKQARFAFGGQKLLIGAGVLVAAAIAVFALRPAPSDTTSSPVTAPAGGMAGAVGDDKVGDVDTMIQQLADRLKTNPKDGEGFRMLGWSYVMTGHPDKAIDPYKRALALLPGSANVHEGYGEALVGLSGGSVTDEAKTEFDKALSIDPKEPRARYFAALWQAQHGQEREALDKWIALANSGPADASWQTDVRHQITVTSEKLGVNVSGKLKAAPVLSSNGASAGASAPMGSIPPSAATEAPPLDPAVMQSANAMAPGERQTMINGMVDGLASRLKANPRDPDGWIRLLRSRMVLKQEDQAGRDLATARKALASDASGLARVNASASELGVPGA